MVLLLLRRPSITYIAEFGLDARKMTDINLSAVLYEKNDLRLVGRPIPEPGEGEVQLSMRKVGICGSDVKYWTSGAIGGFIVTKPMVLGHECSGVVSKVGPGVTHLKEGDRVAIEPHNICGKCEFCKSGQYNQCNDVFFLATPPNDGALSRFLVHAANFVFKIPENVSFEEAAFVEPLSVGLHGCRRAGVTLGSRVLVCGAGPVGLSAMLCAKALGAAAVIMTDVDSKRLEFAEKCGATHTLLITKDTTPQEAATKIAEVIGGAPQHTVECSGAQFSFNLGVYATRRGGTMVLIGHGTGNISFPPFVAIARELTIRGSCCYVNTWPTCLEMISCGKINVKPLITHTFPLEDTLKAFETAKSGQGIKVIIDCAKQS